MSQYVVTDIDLAVLIPERLIKRGSRYFEESRLADLKSDGDTIFGACQGSKPDPYQVLVRFGPEGIVESRYTCPIGGRCMHVAALLFGWMQEQSRFTGVDSRPLDEVLASLSAEELRQQLKRIVAEFPELESRFRT